MASSEVSNEHSADLLNAVGSHPALRHPFLERFSRGANREEIRRFAEQHYLYSCRFARNLASVIANTPDENARSLLVINLYEEIGEPLRLRDRAHFVLLENGLITGLQLGELVEELRQSRRLRVESSASDLDLVGLSIGRGWVTREQVATAIEKKLRETKDLTHPALFRRFMHAIGVEEPAKCQPIAETLAFVESAAALCRDASWLTGLGALGPGTECVVPRLYSQILAGIEKSGIVSASDYIFWTIHVHCDEGHGAAMIEAMRPYLDAPAALETARAGATRMLDARVLWMDGLMETVFPKS
jgi:pyrroloquinoline quinone (PQQ) biosynthesis protein C